MKKRALISVSDKQGVLELAKRLIAMDFEVISTGGTRKLLEQEGIPVIGISEVTGFPEILDGRVKTLHPNIHGGLLARKDLAEHMETLTAHQIKPIDLLVVNLYPFAQTIAKPDVSFADAIENIDIGGPAMLRSSAKNHESVVVLVDQADYAAVLQEWEEQGEVSLATRRRLAAKVFRHTAAYDSMISQYLTEQAAEAHPERLTVTYEKVQDLRYGENPHQKAAFYRQAFAPAASLPEAEQLHGKELSFNNIQDADAALAIVKEFAEPAVVAVKHTNPCGVGIGETILDAYQRAYEADPISIFGGIIAANKTIDLPTAEKLNELFLEIIIAPDFEPAAYDLLAQKKNLRILKLAGLSNKEGHHALQQAASQRLSSIYGGLLVQEWDTATIAADQLEVATTRKPTQEELDELLFAWKVVKHVKSNAIVVSKNKQTIGVGAGQMNRVGAAKIAFAQAGEKAQGAILASDAFFPMPDTIEAAAQAGITAIIQPGGSIKDQDSIDAANQYNIAMVFTGMRHFKH